MSVAQYSANILVAISATFSWLLTIPSSENEACLTTKKLPQFYIFMGSESNIEDRGYMIIKVDL